MREESTSTYVDQHVGGQLALHRKASGLRREQLAELAGIPTMQLQRFERGRDRLSPRQLKALCICLSIEPRDLFDGLEILRARQSLGVPPEPSRRQSRRCGEAS
ncbi:MAG: helix-turn-helix transcriptional regulator [Litorimonas sp.]